MNIINIFDYINTSIHTLEIRCTVDTSLLTETEKY